MNNATPGPRDEWPRWATEPVAVVDADPSWLAAGERERRTLEARLRPWLEAPVHHIGSTAVPGLAAKPILDLMAGVGSLDVADEVSAALEPHGWHLVPAALDARPWRRFLVKVAHDRRVAHLHLLRPTDERWGHQLAFRDHLRRRPDVAARYADLKRRLAAVHAEDRERYSQAKSEFVARVLADERAL